MTKKSLTVMKEKMVNDLIRKYGFEDKRVLTFARVCESCENRHIINKMYNKYITN